MDRWKHSLRCINNRCYHRIDRQYLRRWYIIDNLLYSFYSLVQRYYRNIFRDSQYSIDCREKINLRHSSYRKYCRLQNKFYNQNDRAYIRDYLDCRSSHLDRLKDIVCCRKRFQLYRINNQQFVDLHRIYILRCRDHINYWMNLQICLSVDRWKHKSSNTKRYLLKIFFILLLYIS